MPELPEVETTKNSLQPLFNKTIVAIEVYQPKLRWPVPINLSDLIGYAVKQVERRAKYLILTWALTAGYNHNRPATRKLIIHLGMSGSLQQYPAGSAKRKHDHLIFHFKPADASKVDNLNSLDSPNRSNSPNSLASLDNQANSLDTAATATAAATPATTTKGIQLHYHDPRRFGAVLWYDEYADKLLTHLGAEPLQADFNSDYLYRKIHKLEGNTMQATSSKPITRPIKALLMDQAFVVGVGNIYATESLFLAGIHPSTAANLLTKPQLSTLVMHIVSILQRAIEQGGSTLQDFSVGGGSTGYFQQTLNIYGKHKTPCGRCATAIDKVLITGRASTFCPSCQPLIEARPN